MSFGRNYHYVPAVDVLEDGKYNVKLGKIEEINLAGYNVLRFHFQCVDKKEAHAPNYFDLFDVPESHTEKDVEMFNKRASRIRDCFGLEGEFNPVSYMAWSGKTGDIVIKTGTDGFRNVSKFLPKEGAVKVPPDVF